MWTTLKAGETERRKKPLIQRDGMAKRGKKPKCQDGIAERRKNLLKTVKDGMTEIHPKS